MGRVGKQRWQSSSGLLRCLPNSPWHLDGNTTFAHLVDDARSEKARAEAVLRAVRENGRALRTNLIAAFRTSQVGQTSRHKWMAISSCKGMWSIDG